LGVKKKLEGNKKPVGRVPKVKCYSGGYRMWCVVGGQEGGVGEKDRDGGRYPRKNK